MRLIKLGLISIVFFALMITGVSLFFPSHIRITKAIDIAANKDSVMAQVENISNWKNWYPGADSMKATIITAVTDSTVIASNDEPGRKRGETSWNFYYTEESNTTIVQWNMDIHLRWYPWEKFSSLLLESRYGPTMEKGLLDLKKLFNK
ncbi:MAG: hypothetical protein WBC06_06910 [Chitinophagaceae bacterium]